MAKQQPDQVRTMFKNRCDNRNALLIQVNDKQQQQQQQLTT